MQQPKQIDSNWSNLFENNFSHKERLGSIQKGYFVIYFLLQPNIVVLRDEKVVDPNWPRIARLTFTFSSCKNTNHDAEQGSN